jgi:hypothetical protein
MWQVKSWFSGSGPLRYRHPGSDFFNTFFIFYLIFHLVIEWWWVQVGFPHRFSSHLIFLFLLISLGLLRYLTVSQDTGASFFSPNDLIVYSPLQLNNGVAPIRLVQIPTKTLILSVCLCKWNSVQLRRTEPAQIEDLASRQNGPNPPK